MKKAVLSLVALGTFLLTACEKNPVPNENTSADIIYEIQTNDTGFRRIQFGRFYSLSGSSGINMVNWIIPATPGTYTQKETIRKGFVAELEAAHPTSTNWTLRIKAADGTILKTGTPVYNADSNYYSTNVFVKVQ